MRRSKSRSAIRSVSSSPFSANGRFWPSGPALALLHVKHSCAYSIGRNRPLSKQRLLPPVLHRHRHLSKSRKLKRRTTVSKNGAHLQRCDQRSMSRNMGAPDFFHVSAAPRSYRNSAPYVVENSLSHAAKVELRCSQNGPRCRPRKAIKAFSTGQAASGSRLGLRQHGQYLCRD